MIIFKIIISIILAALLESLEELEIEGRTKHGWARGLPTRRINNVLIMVLIGKEITMYHVFMLLLSGLFFHSCFIFVKWNISTELFVLSALSFYFIIEDFFWFLLNPCYRIKNFKAGKISWHKRWLLGIPLSYWTGLITSGLLLYLGNVLK
jgi:hypothetical protein